MQVISRTAATTSRGGASKLVRPAVKVHPPAAPHLAPGAARYASSTAPPAAWRAAVEAIYAGTFRAIRSGVKVHPGPYSGSRTAPRPSATSPFSTFAQASARRAPRTHFGPRPRPVAVSGPSHVGLGSARQFSSSGYAVFDNVVANAPLALRALADEGLDQRKWKRVKRDVAKKDRAALKGKGKAIDSRLLAAEKRADFERFFGVPSPRSVAAPTPARSLRPRRLRRSLSSLSRSRSSSRSTRTLTCQSPPPPMTASVAACLEPIPPCSESSLRTFSLLSR